MKKNLSLFLLFFTGLLLTMPLYAQEIDGSFKQANELYKQRNYQEAEKLYLQLVKQGSVSGNLYYNLGNVYFKLGLKGKAILYYEKAKKIIPRDKDLTSNLSFLNSIIEDKVETTKRSFFIKKIKDIYDAFSLKECTIAASFFYLLLIVFLIVSFFIQAVRSSARWVAGFLGVLILLFSSFLFGKIYQLKYIKEVVITAREATIYYAPSKAEVPAFILHEGLKLGVTKEKEGWYQVRIGDDKGGWVEKDKAEEI